MQTLPEGWSIRGSSFVGETGEKMHTKLKSLLNKFYSMELDMRVRSNVYKHTK